ncbi:TlpA disulfide reductase family protein [Poseidonocella sedimentorum]|uniref:Thiol-disulfide isomerase or thioredoxin n=1 Tax=Poseidonocella sedimentorum TaxID=871652 RepID=A0A1I6DA18_9RHOB|nr:TlpA disulfide reductase family protein [Poseidonocella sedimentorum]SFR02238.1 Thiol-disulfide isomerase or thioredoxin [Poseidonocella sedimentorum]
MKVLAAAALYTAMALGANAAAPTDLAEYRTGDMKKLAVHAEPKPVDADITFETRDGAPITLGDSAGKYRLVNFWATWCAPCRKEMPALSALQAQLGGDRFEVVTIATGRNLVDGIDRFFAEIGVENLPKHRDPKQALARTMAVLGLPVTVLLDPEGREIARLTGDADWASEEALALIGALISE